MFSLNKKLDPNLKSCLASKSTNNYRVIIKCKKFNANIAKKISSYRGELIRSIKNCNILSANLNSRGIERLLEYPEVEYICFDEYLFLCGMSVNTANKVRLSSKINIKGKGIGIGVIDTGVYPHPDLLSPYNRISSFVDLINGLTHPYDDNGHGTCTCGIIAGSGEKSNGMYRGIAPESNVHCYKAFDKLGKGFISDVLYSMESIIEQSEQKNIKVLCMPFELLYYNEFLQNLFETLVKYANSKNITCVIPSGSNRNLDGSITGIALCKDCITVAGFDTTSIIKPYTYSSAGNSKRDTKPNLAAACVDIVSLNCNTKYISEKDGIKLYAPKLDASYKTFTGTSLAAAYIAAICALLYESNPDLNSKDVFSLLKVSCENIDIPKNYQGEGKVNLNLLLK
ncbi:S8 family serine peptidase [Clostridium carnis]